MCGHQGLLIVILVVVVFVIESAIFKVRLALVIIFEVLGPADDGDLAVAHKDAHAGLDVEIALALYASVVFPAGSTGIERDAHPEARRKGRLADKEDGAVADARHRHARVQAQRRGRWRSCHRGRKGKQSGSVLYDVLANDFPDSRVCLAFILRACCPAPSGSALLSQCNGT